MEQEEYMTSIRRWMTITAVGVTGLAFLVPAAASAATKKARNAQPGDSDSKKTAPNYYHSGSTAQSDSGSQPSSARDNSQRSGDAARTLSYTARYSAGQTVPVSNVHGHHHNHGVAATQGNYYLPQSQQPNYYHQPESQPQEQKRGMFGSVWRRSSNAVKKMGETIRPCKYTGTVQTGSASWYGGRFHGGKTASGERYDMNSMTAAHRTLPFGTLVKVKNLVNGRECVVRINNRGPFIKGRILDMSKAAARELGFMGRGIVKVQMQVLGVGE